MIEKSSNGVTIRLGNAKYYAKNHEIYKISYKVHSSDLDLGGIQSFYYNLVGDKWGNDIHSSTFTIHMPKEFDASKINFYTDGYNVDPNLKYKVIGNTIKGSLDTTISYGRGITIKLDLPDNYFNYKDDNIYQIISVAVSIIMLAFFGITWTKHGKDDEVIVTVEFEAPEDLSSAGVGYIIKSHVDNKDIASLFLEWANKGYITISDTKNQLVFNKIKDVDENEHSYSKEFFNKIFRGRNSISTKQLVSKYDDYYKAQLNIISFFNTKERQLFVKTSDAYQILFTFLTALPISLSCAYAIYLQYYDAVISIIVGVSIAMTMIVSTVMASDLVKNSYYNKIFKKLSKSIATIILLLIPFGISIIISLVTKMSLYLLIILWIITIINIVISAIMQKRTKYGTEVLGKVLGLKDFIEHAEKDRLNMLFEQDPQIYYKILPYAYVFGLTKVWTKHFKDMEMVQPTWYVGDSFSHTRFYSNMTSSMAAVSNPTPPASSRSGGGGGFSGGGGGGSSGGGFGGSSGGNW